MKREALIGAFIIISLIGFASAINTCSSPDQIILRLSADTNAHGEVYNGAGSYTTEICYNQIFSNAPTPGTRICSGSNTVLRLSSSTNAHAEQPSGTIYGLPVCYRDLSCTLRTSTCQGTEVEVAHLSGAANAHLETSSGTSYTQFLCCSSVSAPGLGCDPACTGANICDNGVCVTPSAPACGNGNIDTGEGCDSTNFEGKTCASLVPGTSGSLTCNSCVIDTSGCTIGGGSPSCGNGIVESGEQCDDSNTNNGDGCSSVCTIEAGGVVCGNGVIESPEQCDDSNTNNGDGCSASCTLESGVGGTPRAYWADSDGNEFGVNAELLLDTNVQLIAQGVGASGAVVTYDIYDSDCLFFVLDESCSDHIRTETAATDSNGIARLLHTLSLSDFTGNDDNDDRLELFFVAKDGGSYSQKSGRIDLVKEVSEVIPIGKEGCAQFDNQQACNAAPQSAWGYDSIKHNIDCGPYSGGRIECQCVWESNSCMFRWTNIPNNVGFSDDCVGGCNIESQYGECVDDRARITYLTNFAALSSCPVGGEYINSADQQDCDALDGQFEDISCALAPSLILPFFGGMQFITSICILFGIYIFIALNRRSD